MLTANLDDTCTEKQYLLSYTENQHTLEEHCELVFSLVPKIKTKIIRNILQSSYSEIIETDFIRFANDDDWLIASPEFYKTRKDYHGIELFDVLDKHYLFVDPIRAVNQVTIGNRKDLIWRPKLLITIDNQEDNNITLSSIGYLELTKIRSVFTTIISRDIIWR